MTGPAPERRGTEAGAPRPMADALLDVLDDDEQHEHALTGQDEHRRTRIAWLYYVEGRTQAQIADQLGLSRIKVVRDLAVCRETGLVQIRINGRLASCVAFEQELVARYGLREALVVPTPAEHEGIPATLGVAVGAHVSDRLQPNETVGVGWGRTLHWSVRAIRRRHVAGLKVVSLLGGIGRGLEINTYETASRFAEVVGAECYYLAAPTFASSRELRDMLLAQPGIREIRERAAMAQMALVSAGSLDSDGTMRRLGLITEHESAELRELKAVGDLLGSFIDEEGTIVDHPLNERVVGLPPAELKRLPHTILASGGLDKVKTIRGALKGRYVNTLITDESTAAAVLEG